MDNKDLWRDPTGQALVNEAPAGLHPSGFDPSRTKLGIREQAIAAAQTAIYDNLLDADMGCLHYPAIAAFDAVMATLKSAAGGGRGGWCCAAARSAQVARRDLVFALGGSSLHLGDDDIFVACLEAIDASAIETGTAETAGLGPEAESAGPQGDAQGHSA